MSFKLLLLWCIAFCSRSIWCIKLSKIFWTFRWSKTLYTSQTFCVRSERLMSFLVLGKVKKGSKQYDTYIEKIKSQEWYRTKTASLTSKHKPRIRMIDFFLPLNKAFIEMCNCYDLQSVDRKVLRDRSFIPILKKMTHFWMCHESVHLGTVVFDQVVQMFFNQICT